MNAGTKHTCYECGQGLAYGWFCESGTGCEVYQKEPKACDDYIDWKSGTQRPYALYPPPPGFVPGAWRKAAAAQVQTTTNRVQPQTYSATDWKSWPCYSTKCSPGWVLRVPTHWIQMQHLNVQQCGDCKTSFSYKELKTAVEAEILCQVYQRPLPLPSTPAPTPTAKPVAAGTCVGCGKPPVSGLTENFCEDMGGFQGACGLALDRCGNCGWIGAAGFKCVGPKCSTRPIVGNAPQAPAPPPSPAFTLSKPSYHITLSGLGYLDDAPKKSAVAKGKTCSSCGVDWCEYLDAYHGTDKKLATRCSRCRK